MKVVLSLARVLGLVLVFWNVENLMDERYRVKTPGIAKVILSLSDSLLEPPAIIGLAEVESDKPLKDLVYNTALRKYGYKYVHYDSHDRRGIDCALLYRPSVVGNVRSKAVPLRDTAIIATRDILICEFDSLTVVVCHLPSKRGGSSLAARRRVLALETLANLADSLPSSRLFIFGDFNDTRSLLSDSLLSPLRELTPLWLDGREGQEPGSIKYQGEWELIDRCLVRDSAIVEGVRVADLEMLMTRDTKYGGEKPLRTYSGPRYLGGLSDHLPLVITTRVDGRHQK